MIFLHFVVLIICNREMLALRRVVGDLNSGLYTDFLNIQQDGSCSCLPPCILAVLRSQGIYAVFLLCCKLKTFVWLVDVATVVTSMYHLFLF